MSRFTSSVSRSSASGAVATTPVPAHQSIRHGRGDSEASLRERAVALRLDDRVVFHGRIPIEDVPAAVAAADIGIAPTRHDEFTDVSLSTKIFEYAAMDKSVVASRLPLVRHTFPSGSVSTYEPGDADDLSLAIERLIADPLAREAAVARTSDVVQGLAWEREAERYVDLVDRLARGR